VFQAPDVLSGAFFFGTTMSVLRASIAPALAAALVIGGAGYYLSGRGQGPVIDVVEPQRVLGRAGTLVVTVETPGDQVAGATIALEQDGASRQLFSLGPETEATVTQETASRIRISRPLGKESVPDLKAGTARLTVTAARSVFFGLRTIESTLTKDLLVRLEPPKVGIVSTHHFVNHGGAEFAVYRVSPPDVESGVMVGDERYPGYPARGFAGAGLASDPSLRAAFFALLPEQDLATPISLYARDEAGNEGSATFEHRVFPRPFKRSRIEIDAAFLARVVPAIARTVPELGLGTPAGDDLLPAFLKVNGELRRMNAETIRGLASRTSSEALWRGAFQQLGNSQVESMFADHRTYFHEGREIDQQVHLGFDLAVTANVPVQAANSGTVVFAGDLGIYGNTVVLDHGMGVQSLYAHLSSLEVAPNDRVEKAQVLGRSGMTGLAGGDHLHFTMLVQGRPVNPVEWWDAHWIEDRVTRKLDEAAGAGGTAAR
jgi:murein DD-endopeptidase MepM/ murein hydrolase activator NlpD